MSWGTDLWDQYDNLEKYTLKGIEFCEKYARFVKDRCEIENEYASKLKKLVKNYQPKKKVDDEEFTFVRGFVAMVNEIHDVAGQHEQIAENLYQRIYKELQTLIGQVKKDRREHMQEANKLTNTVNQQTDRLEKVKKKYERSFNDADKAAEAYKKADLDINLSRADVEKAKQIMQSKQQQCETCKKEYAAELQKTNAVRSDHYTTLLPKVFTDMQALEERRINQVKSFISHSADTERSVIPIVNTCIDGIVKAASTVNPQQDIRLVIEKYKSGFTPPGDIPFEDLSNPNGNVEESNHTPHQHTPKAQRSDTFRGTQSGGKTQKRKGLFGIFSSSKGEETREDYSHLPPNQQKKRLRDKIENIRQSINKETAERDGMQKMRDVYVQNPGMGDAQVLDGQLEENAAKIDKLNKELSKFEGYLRQAESGGPSAEAPNNTQQPSPPTSNTNETPASTTTTAGGDNSTEVPYKERDSFDDDLDDDFLIIGHCKALYGFEATNEGSIPMTEGQEFQVVEADQGDGWTRVRASSGDEGFVPTTYVTITLYS